MLLDIISLHTFAAICSIFFLFTIPPYRSLKMSIWKCLQFIWPQENILIATVSFVKLLPTTLLYPSQRGFLLFSAESWRLYVLDLWRTAEKWLRRKNQMGLWRFQDLLAFLCTLLGRAIYLKSLAIYLNICLCPGVPHYFHQVWGVMLLFSRTKENISIHTLIPVFSMGADRED